MGDNEYGEKLKDLRSKAEKVLAEKGSSKKLTIEIDELIHELQVHQIELEMQNDELKKSQLNLQTSQNRYFDLYNFAPTSYFTLDEKELINEVNVAGIALLGVEKRKLINSAFIRFIAHDSRNKFSKLVKSVIGNKDHRKCELKLLKDKIPIPVIMEINSSTDKDGSFKSLLITAVDITERKEAEEKIKKALEEKEILLKEIHHRVKNNLMIISSLLNIQSQYIKDKTSKDIFKESQNRARSMALIHERLYQSTDLKRIDFGDYIRTLSNELLRTYSSDFDLIEMKINVENIFLDINTAIPLGLMVNELVTNSLKHAFPDGKSGVINVDFQQKDNHYEFTVKDNGIGFPEDLDFRNTDSLGLQMVNSLTGQIDGEIGLNQSHGTEFKITFHDLSL